MSRVTKRKRPYKVCKVVYDDLKNRFISVTFPESPLIGQSIAVRSHRNLAHCGLCDIDAYHGIVVEYVNQGYWTWCPRHWLDRRNRTEVRRWPEPWLLVPPEVLAEVDRVLTERSVIHAVS